MIEIAPMEYIFLVKLEGAAEFIPLYMRFDRGRWIVMHIAGLNRQALASLVTEEGPWKMYLEYLRVKEAIVTPAELKTQIAIEVNQGLMANLGALGRRLSTTNLNYPQQLKALQLTGPTVVAVGGTPVQAIKSTPVALGKMAGELAEPVVVSGEEAPAYYEFETAYATAGHAELAKKAEVRFNIVAIPPTVIVGKEAEEFVKTPVRYSALPIIYQPLTANMLVIMQRPKQPAAIEEGPAEEVVFLVAKPGEPVIVPAGWGHVIVNRNAKQFEETPLFVASWSAEQPSQETTLFAKLGGAAYYVVRTEQGITVSPNYKYLANYGNVPPLKVVAPANVTPLGLEAGKPIYDIISSKGKFARLAYFLGHGAFQLNPQETAVFEEPLPAGEKGSLITGIKKGELVTPKAFREIPPFLPPESKLEELLGPKVTIIKAASAGAPSAEVMIPDVSIFKVEPTEVKLFAGRGEEVTKVSTLEQKAWEIGVLRKIDQLKLAGLIFPEPATTEQAERAKEEIPAIIQQLQPLTTEPAKIIAEAEVAQRVSGEREAIMVPVTAKETVFMIEQPGTYKPVMAMRTIAEEVVAKQSKEERGAILLDFNTLGSTRAKPDGSQVFVPSDYVMKAISLLNALEQTTIGGKPRYHIAVYSNELNADQMRAALGVLASPFTDFIQTPTVAEAVDNIAREQNINPDRVVVTLAQITLQKYPEILGRLAEAVRIAMVATPKAGEYISYKAVLLNSLKLLEGILAPTEITGLRSAIETAPVIRGTTIEPEKDEDKAISRMQAAYAV
jgi:oxalate decarboxylase/phosphoglucose isomerase-like protein (cupin superfamily)